MLRIVLGAAFSGSLHFYVWWRLVRTAQLPRRWHLAASIFMVAMWLAIPVTTTARLWWPQLSMKMSWFTMPWMALIGLLFVVSLALHISSALARAGRAALRRPPPSEHQMSRRLFLARVTSGAAVTVDRKSVV